MNGMIEKANEYSYENLEEGSSEQFSVAITQDMMEHFFDVCSDVSPIHHDPNVARKYGFKDCVVYGMCTASFYSTLVGTYLPGRRCFFQECNTQFLKPVYVGDIITVKGTVTDINTKVNCVTIKAEVRNQDGVKVSRAKLIVSIMEDVK